MGHSKVFPGSRNLAPDSCVAIATITTQESEARLREPGKTLGHRAKATPKYQLPS